MPCALSRLQLRAQNCDHVTPPPNPYISETAFSHRFQKAHTYAPRGTGALDQKLRKLRRNAILLHVGTFWMSHRDMPAITVLCLVLGAGSLSNITASSAFKWVRCLQVLV